MGSRNKRNSLRLIRYQYKQIGLSMDIKNKSNNELLALMLINLSTSDTYKISYKEFMSRYDESIKKEFSDYNDGPLPIINELINDLQTNSKIDEELWNENKNMGIKPSAIERYKNIFLKKEQEIGILK
jgi:hypothetical protein